MLSLWYSPYINAGINYPMAPMRQVLQLSGEARLRLTVPCSMLGASLRKMVAKQLPIKPGATTTALVNKHVAYISMGSMAV